MMRVQELHNTEEWDQKWQNQGNSIRAVKKNQIKCMKNCSYHFEPISDLNDYLNSFATCRQVWNMV